MTLTSVKELPKRKPFNTNLTMVFKEFMSMDAKIVRIDPIKEGYKTPTSLAASFSKALKRGEYFGKIRVIQRNGMVYLIKIDLLEESV